MDKNRLKKYIKNMVIILILLLIFIVLLRVYLTSKNYVLHMLTKGDKNVNYSISYNNDEMVDYVKGYEEKLVFSDGKIYYANYKSGEAIFIDSENKTIKLKKVDAKNGPHSSLYMTDMDRMNFEYDGTKSINSNKCIAIKLSDNKENDNLSYITKKLYINMKSGVIEKIEKYKTSYYEEKLLLKKVYKMSTGEVTEKDISKPDLNEYSSYTIIDER